MYIYENFLEFKRSTSIFHQHRAAFEEIFIPQKGSHFDFFKKKIIVRIRPLKRKGFVLRILLETEGFQKSF